MVLATVAIAAVLLAGAPTTHAGTPHRSAATVVSVYQTPARITEQSSFSVYLEVASTTNIHQVYFTFCQLSSALCYLPVPMFQEHGSNWYAGTTKAMSTYSGMKPGVVGGYNITIAYNDGSNSTEPVVPNHFANLTLNQSVTGEWMYQITVSPDLFNLSGRVVDALTGVGIAGANVSLTPANASPTVTDPTGGYSFAGLTNGSYTVTVSKSGYQLQQGRVLIAGTPAMKEFNLSAKSGTATASPGFFSTPTGYGVIAVVAIAALAAAALGLRARRGKAPPDGSSVSSETGPGAS
jgi:hypothetical protein